jgi:rod shape-determining protein MreC
MKPLNLLALLLFLGGLVWALTLSDSTVREIQRGYYAVISPFLTKGSQLETHIRGFSDEVQTSKELTEMLAVTNDELGRLRLVEDRFQQLEAENSQLREALNFKKQAPFKAIAAQVIRRQPSTWWRTVIIDRGEESGVGVQVPVLAGKGLVGKIDQPLKGMSTVILLTDEDCRVSAKVEGTPEVGILSGQRGQFDGSPLLRLRYLSKNAGVRPGMKVFTTGRGGLFPANVLLGTIESFETGTFDAEALVRPSVDFADLNTVFVLSGKEQP